MLNSLSELFQRDLGKVQRELELYENESDIWLVEKSISNSAGNLALHLCGNLNHFIGATLGNSGYIRDREAEFSNKNLSRKAIIKQIESTISIVNSTLVNITVDELKSTYPIEVFGKPITTEFFLLHLLSHLNYHLGQINYHRRLITRAISFNVS